MTEPICKKCNMDLYTVLRTGHCSLCESHTADFGEPYPTPYEFPKDDETKREACLDRFSPVFTGFSWFVVDKMGGWYPMNEKNHAEDRAKAWSYEWDQIVGARIGGA